MHCRICGHIFCYTDDDIDANERNKQIAKLSELNAFVSYGGSLYQINEADKQLERDKAKIKDYTKCPNCNSADIEELSKAEIETIKSQIGIHNIPVVKCTGVVMYRCGVISQCL